MKQEGEDRYETTNTVNREGNHVVRIRSYELVLSRLTIVKDAIKKGCVVVAGCCAVLFIVLSSIYSLVRLGYKVSLII